MDVRIARILNWAGGRVSSAPPTTLDESEWSADSMTEHDLKPDVWGDSKMVCWNVVKEIGEQRSLVVGSLDFELC